MSNLTKKFDLFNELMKREEGYAIVSLIEQTIGDEMDRVLNKLDSIDAKFDSIDAKFDSIDAKFDSINSRLNSMEKSFDSRLNSMEKGFDSRLDSIEKRISVLYWFIGAVITIATMAVRYLTH